MVIQRQITIASIFFIFFSTPMSAMAIPITYEFDAIDLWNTNPEFSGSISIESTTLGVQTSPASDPSYYPGAFFYADAIISVTLNYGTTTETWLGGSIYNDCTYDPSFYIVSLRFEIAMPSCLPGADQPDLSNFDLTDLNGVIFYADPALFHPGTSEYSPIAYPFNFRQVTPIPEPAIFMLIILGIAVMGFVRRIEKLSCTLSSTKTAVC